MDNAFSEIFAWSDFQKDDSEIINERLLKQLHAEIVLARKGNYLQKISKESLIRMLCILEKEIRKTEQLTTKDNVIELLNVISEWLDS